MKYVKPEIEEIKLLNPIVFCGISDQTDDPNPFDNSNSNSNGSWLDQQE